jgi:hypothetical protein
VLLLHEFPQEQVGIMLRLLRPHQALGWRLPSFFSDL